MKRHMHHSVKHTTNGNKKNSADMNIQVKTLQNTPHSLISTARTLAIHSCWQQKLAVLNKHISLNNS